MNWIYNNLLCGRKDSKLCVVYDALILCAIILSSTTLIFKDRIAYVVIVEIVTLFLFAVDYVLRLMTANLKLKKGKKSFLIYPITPGAIIDLLCLLPILALINSRFAVLSIFRLAKCIRMFKLLRFSKNFTMITNVLKKEKEVLGSILALSVGYILFTALIMYNLEDSFESFFDSVYWAVTALTTVGYGDIYPISDIGRVISMLSSLFGIAIVALPAGVITASFLEEIKENKKNESEKKEEEKVGR